MVTNVSNVVIDGQAGTDTINLNGANVAGTLTLSAETVTGTALTAATLVLDNIGQFGTDLNSINTAIDTLQLVNAGPVYINESNDLIINTTGTLTNPGLFTIAGITTIDTDNGSLTLDNPLNDFDTVNVRNTREISLYDVDNIAAGTLLANRINLHTVTGVGTAGGPLQTGTANLDITNTHSGGVYISNNQAVTVGITNLGDIALTNTQGNVTVERLYANGGDYSVPAPVAGYIGDVTLDVRNGNTVTAYTGPGSHSMLDAPDIIAENLTVGPQGDFGTPSRYMSIRVNNTFAFYGARGFVYYFSARPAHQIGADDIFDFSSLATGIFNQQLVEVESLSEIDPAIFTDVRNYSYADLAIKMPSDQLYDEDDEEKEEEKEEDDDDESEN